MAKAGRCAESSLVDTVGSSRGARRVRLTVVSSRHRVAANKSPIAPKELAPPMSEPSLDATPPPVGGVALTRESRANREAWIERNPLRSWRLNQSPPITLSEAAERLNVGVSMIQQYERGVHKPGSKAQPALALYLGADWSLRWDEWLATRDREVKL